MSLQFPHNINDPYWDDIHPGMPAKIKHRLIIIRHGESTSNKALTSSNEVILNTTPQLTAKGHLQSANIAKHLTNYGLDNFDNIYVSPQYRAYQTAEPILDKIDLSKLRITDKIRERTLQETEYVKLAPKLITMAPNDIKTLDLQDNIDGVHWARKHETQLEFSKRVEEMLNEWKGMGDSKGKRQQTLVFTHSIFMSQLLTLNNPTVFFHLMNGSYIIMDIDENNIVHVHASNFVEHLDNRTGHHNNILSRQEGTID